MKLKILSILPILLNWITSFLKDWANQDPPGALSPAPIIRRDD